jgi:hypothetical protein
MIDALAPGPNFRVFLREVIEIRWNQTKSRSGFQSWEDETDEHQELLNED